MKTLKKFDVFAAGMAIFAMFFGAGNIVFPLALGQYALNKTPFALIGLLITGVIMPFTGLLTMFLYKGQMGTFFSRLGKIPGLLLGCFTISLVGPLGCSPRCIALAYSTISVSFPGVPLILFSAATCFLIFLFLFKKGNILNLIGYFLSPIKISLLVFVVVVGLVKAPSLAKLLSDHTSTAMFFHGLKQGYNTMDLLGSFFFAPVILASLASRGSGTSESGLFRFILKACGIGAALLAIIYVAFCYLAYCYSAELVGVPLDQLLGTVVIKVLGPIGGLVVCFTVVAVCFTTAIALTAAFASYAQTELFRNKINYTSAIIGTLAVTFIMTTFEFSGIVAYLFPILEWAYPVMIALTLFNLVYYFVAKRRKEVAVAEPETVEIT